MMQYTCKLMIMSNRLDKTLNSFEYFDPEPFFARTQTQNYSE